jgi:hypothetical protein
VAFFFVSFVLIVGMVLANVVLTVLLDEFLGSVRREQERIENELAAEDEVRSIVMCSLSPPPPFFSHVCVCVYRPAGSAECSIHSPLPLRASRAEILKS